MSKRLKVVISVLALLVVSANLARFAFETPTIESEVEAKFEFEIEEFELEPLLGTHLSDIVAALAILPTFQQGASYLLGLSRTSMLFIPFYQSDLNGVSPPPADL